jgi:hypothetical protein
MRGVDRNLAVVALDEAIAGQKDAAVGVGEVALRAPAGRPSAVRCGRPRSRMPDEGPGLSGMLGSMPGRSEGGDALEVEIGEVGTWPGRGRPRPWRS